MNQLCHKNGYKYFCTNDPRSWETLEVGNVHRNFQDAAWQNDRQWQGAWTQGAVVDSNFRRGQGQLAGGDREREEDIG